MTDSTTISSSVHADEDGAVMIETAFAFMLFFLMLWGIITFGVIFSLDHTMNAAASEGARASISTLDETEAITVAQASASAVMATYGANAANATIGTPVITDCVAPANARCLTITISYPWSTSPIIPSLLPIVTPNVISSTATVQLSH